MKCFNMLRLRKKRLRTKLILPVSIQDGGQPSQDDSYLKKAIIAHVIVLL